MSTLAETYTLGAGVPLSRPTIPDAFFPLPFPIEKVILIHAFAGTIEEQGGQRVAVRSGKCFDYYQEVVALLSPIVGPLGYCFVQIGAAHEPQLKGVHYLCGQTTMQQCAYLVKNAALLIANDSMWVHVRGAYDGALVALYGTTSKPHFPYWRTEDKTVLIESHRGGKKPAYANQEAPKTVNWITPESVVNAALRVLGPIVPVDAKPQVSISGNLQGVVVGEVKFHMIASPIIRQSLYIGPNYNEPILEVIPNCVVPPPVQTPQPPVLRMDYVFNEDAFVANLRQRKCAFITDREINLNLLVQLKPQIAGARIEIDRISTDWIKAFMRLGIPSGLFTTDTDEEKVRARRMELLDICRFDTYVHPTKADATRYTGTYLNRELPADFDWTKASFKTNKLLLSDGKLFLSKAHLDAGQSVASADDNTGTVIDTPAFWTDLAHQYLFTP